MFRNEPVSPVRTSGLAMVFFAAAMVLWGTATGHSTLKKTSPASGSVLAASPEKISIEFNEAARLTAVVAAGADGSERRLKFEPENSATLFTVLAPQLAPGRNEVRWTALSKDGHVIKGTIILVVKPPAAPTAAGVMSDR